MLFLSLALSTFAHAQLCSEWSAPVKVGALDQFVVNEASGLALSRQFPGRAYHVNDSGDGPFFYTTDLSGQNTQRVSFAQTPPTDVEDIAVGPCADGQCVFVADIGDNARARPHLTLWITPEEKIFPAEPAARAVTLAYPDGPHDAESIAVHPVTGDLYLFTKEVNWTEEKSFPGRFYRAPRAALAQPGIVTLEFLGEIDLPFFLPDHPYDGQIATSMDISPDGTRLLILNYQNAVEVEFSRLRGPIDSRAWVSGVDYRVIPWIRNTSQQEAVAYALDGKSFFYTSEYNPDLEDTEAPIFQVSCRRGD